MPFHVQDEAHDEEHMGQFSAQADYLVSQSAVTKAMLAKWPNARIREEADIATRSMIRSLEVGFLKRCIHAESKGTIRVPADWWQALKERWIPKRIAGVRYREIPVRYELWAVCPHIPIGDDRDREVHYAFLWHKGAGGPA